MVPISVCMIAKNEEQNVELCLKPLKEAGFELIIIDTGSSDNTVSLAKKYTNHVYHFTWLDDFSAARNYAASLSSNDWILVVDFDEYSSHLNIDSLLLHMQVAETAIGTITRHNPCHLLSGQKSVMAEQVARFYNKKYHQYEGIIHEQLFPKDKSEPQYLPVDATFYHHGYVENKNLTSKANRNLSLLLKALLSNANDPYLLYQTGKCYQILSDWKSACNYFDKGLSFNVNPSLVYVQDMIISYGYCLLEMKDYQTALQLTNVYELFDSNADFIFLIGLIYMNNALFDSAIREFQKAASIKSCCTEGVNSYMANYNIGVIYECTNHPKEAAIYYKRCGSYEPALKRLSLIQT